MADSKAEPNKKAENTRQSLPVLSAILRDGRMVELLYDGAARETRFAVWDGERYELTAKVALEGDEELIPYSAKNSLLRHNIVLFPSAPLEFGTQQDLMTAIRSYLHRYVDLPENFERLAACYVLLTWVYDRFNELPYLRLRGDYGTGKTRFLLTLGSVCYKPIFASGASSVSPLFHMLDRFGGTLIIDEADFRFSDEKSDLVKILNNGNVRGFPVLRSESRDGREFNPRAFQVFGPKIVGMRTHFDDPALESRFITETAGNRAMRPDIPINLPAQQRIEAEELRNKLLLYRFRTFKQVDATPATFDTSLEPRINQIYAPLSAVIGDEAAREDLRKSARANSARLKAERGASVEAEVLTVIRSLLEASQKANLAIKDISDLFMRTYASEYERPVTNKWLGHVVRRKLNLVTQKSHGVFVIPGSERAKLTALFERYGVAREDGVRLKGSPSVDLGDLGDIEAGQAATEVRE